MLTVIKTIEKNLAASKKILVRAKMNPQEAKEIAVILCDLVRLLQYIDGPTFQAVFREVERDYFKLISGSYSEALFEHCETPAPADSGAGSAVPPEKGYSAQADPAEPVEQKPVQAPPAPAFAPVVEGKKLIAFLCKQCGKRHDAFPLSGKCDCGNGSFKTVDVVNSPEHDALCQELQATLSAPVVKAPALDFAAPAAEAPAPVAPVTSTVRPPVTVTVQAPPESGLLCVLNKDFWACDNEKCGSDDLVHEVPVPPPDKHQIGSRYQCLKCGHIGQILLQYEELIKLRGASNPVVFKLGADDYKLLVQQRDGPVASETRTAPTPPVKTAAAPGILPPASAVEAPPKKARGRPKKNQETPAEKPESFPGLSSNLNQTVGATNNVQAPQAPAANSKSIAALVTEIAGYEAPQIDKEALAAELEPQVEEWPMEKLLKEWEALTNKVCDPVKGVPVVPPDKNLRQVLKEQVIAEMVGKTCGVDA